MLVCTLEEIQMELLVMSIQILQEIFYKVYVYHYWLCYQLEGYIGKVYGYYKRPVRRLGD